MIIFLLDSARAAFFVSSALYNSSIFVFLLIIFIFSNYKFDYLPIVIIVAFIIINLLSAVYNRGMVYSQTGFFSIIIKLMISYMIIKMVGYKFLELFIKYIYRLSIIGIVCYVIITIIPDIVDRVPYFFNQLAGQRQARSGGFYLFFFNYNPWAKITLSSTDVIIENSALLRNSGFMWEPGAYALVLAIALALELCLNGINNKKIITVFLLATITTFSTAGYLAMYFLILVLLEKNKKINKGYKYIFLLPVIFYGAYVIYQLPFMEGKINVYFNNPQFHKGLGSERIYFNRLGYIINSVNQSLYWPFGNGIFESSFDIKKFGKVTSGASTVGSILYTWGWLGLVVFFLSIKNFFYSISKGARNIALFSTLAVLIVFASNPVAGLTVSYMFLYYYYLFNKQTKIKNYADINLKEIV